MSNKTNYPKRLIEVDLPIKRISAHARREKSIRHGHISTLHIWWARRPLAACRAVICASLWIDPVDELCPQEFRDKAARIINDFAKKVATDKDLANHCSTESWSKWKVLAQPENQLDPNNPQHLNILRYRLLDFIADFANWDNSTQPDYLETSGALTQAAHEALGGVPGTRPLVVDPFAGGGAIPLEALRVGADAFASDLNPVAVLLNKVVLEYIPKYGQKLADEVRKWGKWVKEEAEKELADFYPKDADGSTPIAYLWARTIVCEGPGCGLKVPLARTFWLTKRSSCKVGVRIKYSAGSEIPVCEVISGNITNLVTTATVRRGAVSCPCCGFTTPVQSVRRQLSKQRGGANDGFLLAIVANDEAGKRIYRTPTKSDYEIVDKVEARLKQQRHSNTILSLAPDEPLPPNGTLGFRVQNYGMQTFGDLHTKRQKLALATIASIIRNLEETAESIVVHQCLLLAFGRLQDLNSSLSTWADTVVGANRGQNRLPMVWDFVEAVPFADAGGSWSGQVDWVVRAINHVSMAISHTGIAMQAPAQMHPLPDDSAHLVATDPPYYDAFAYSDLSDLFLCWLKRATLDPKTLFSLESVQSKSPKQEEIVVNPAASIDGRGPKDHIWFSSQMLLAFRQARRITKPNGLSVIIFAHKGMKSWEALLDSAIDSEWTITGSWPIDTERPSRQRAQESAALASSIHLVCRPRNTNDIGDWRDVLQELPQRIHDWMPRLASEGVVGADAIFACLGPALEIFSRYSSVEKASGEVVTLREYLEYVWAAISKEALSTIFKDADTSSFEEDARLTAMWLWTLSSGGGETGKMPVPQGDGKTGKMPVPQEEEDVSDDDDESTGKKAKITGFSLEYDAARKIAQGLGANLENLASLVQVKGDQARLLPVSERSPYLLGKDAGQAPVKRPKKEPKQLSLFDTSESTADEVSEDWGDTNIDNQGKTVLDRIHQTMILFAAGRSEALKRFLVDDGVGSDKRFWTLAQSLSALYPAGTDEKRWVDGVLARKKGLGF